MTNDMIEQSNVSDPSASESETNRTHLKLYIIIITIIETKMFKYTQNVRINLQKSASSPAEDTLFLYCKKREVKNRLRDKVCARFFIFSNNVFNFSIL